MSTKYVIVGNGAAGAEAAINIRERDSDALITMVTESRYLHYYRPRLIDFLVEGNNPDDLVIYDDEWYRKHRIRNVLGSKIVRIDVEAKKIFDTYGSEFVYDRLLLASGSKPFVPPIPGIERPGVLTLRSFTDANSIKQYSSTIDEVVVIGGGLLGLENANSLLRLGKKVTVVEFERWLLPRQLDQDGGTHLQKMLEKKGINFVLGDQVVAIDGTGPEADSPVDSVLLKSGGRIKAGAIIVSTGIRGDMDFLKGSPILVNRGVVIDDFMRTNIADIWAAGDLAEHKGIIYGLWTVAKEQGRFAGLNMAGQETRYEGSLPSSILKITGIDVFSMGDVKSPVLDNAIKEEDGDKYRKLILDADGKPKAAMVVGDKSGMQTAQKIMKGTKSPEEFRTR